jgi:hypothetical protein
MRAVIIPTYNEQSSLAPTVLAALKDTNVEVIISVIPATSRTCSHVILPYLRRLV